MMNKKLSVLFLLPLLGIAACSGSSKASINKQGDVLKGDVLKANIGKADQYRFNSSSIELGFESKKIEGISDIKEESDRKGLRIVIDIKILHLSPYELLFYLFFNNEMIKIFLNTAKKLPQLS